MAIIPWHQNWRRFLTDPTANLQGVGYFAKESLWICAGISSKIYTVPHADLIGAMPFWVPRSDGGGSSHAQIASDASRAVIAGDNNWLNESTDGITWSGVKTTPDTSVDLHGVAAGPNTAGVPYDTFVAVSNESLGSIYERGVSATWFRIDTGAASDELWDVCTDGAGVWVACGEQGASGLVAHSTDPALTWTRYLLGTTNYRACAYGNGLFMLGGTAGLIQTSATGLSGSWTAKSTGGGDAVEGLTYLGGSSWLATSNTSNIYLSTDDGTSWSPESAIASDSVFHAASDAGLKTTVLAAGQNIWGSFEEAQADYTVPPGIVTPTAPLALAENTEHVGDSIRRLVQRFRS